ncbi:MAG: glutamyl-tRNA reductase [Oscillibacter sp.]|nr:glutamyl-tRNA reductase [Oscillibacter sp.]
MPIWVAGIDHNRADLDTRGAFSLTKKKAAEAYEAFRAIGGLNGCVLLSTCNRTEWWLSAAEDAEFSPVETLCAFLGLDAADYRDFFFEYAEPEAVNHLFRLAAGLESRIIGEDQILTQVGEALQAARAAYAADHVLETLFRRAVTAGKRVKTEAAFPSGDRSVMDAALRTLDAGGFSVSGKKCLVIGNGVMGKLSALALVERGADVTVTVRQYSSGVLEIPRGCARINYGERYAVLPRCDLVVSATTSPNYTLCTKELSRLSVGHPVCLLDLAVPRDIEPGAGALPGFTLYDVDSFRLTSRSEAFRRNMARAEEILEEEKREFYRWYQGRDLIPRIQALKEAAARNTDARLTPVYRELRLNAEEKAALQKEVEGAAERMMNRLLFGLRDRLPDPVFSQCVDAMEFVFGGQP